jgi:hypothetical protein
MKRLGRPAHGSDEAEQPRSMPLRILAHDSGAVVTARMDVYWHADMQRWAPATAGDAAIAGVPGTGAGVVIESPVSDVLPTGRPVDTINVDGLGSIVSASLASAPLSRLSQPSRSGRQRGRHGPANDFRRGLLPRPARCAAPRTSLCARRRCSADGQAGGGAVRCSAIDAGVDKTLVAARTKGVRRGASRGVQHNGQRGAAGRDHGLPAACALQRRECSDALSQRPAGVADKSWSNSKCTAQSPPRRCRPPRPHMPIATRSSLASLRKAEASRVPPRVQRPRWPLRARHRAKCAV